MKKFFLALAVTAGFLAGCGGDALPPGVMSEEEMTEFLTEAYLIEGFYAIETGYHYESLTPEIVASYENLLKEMGLTKKQYERSRDYYMRHPDRYERIHSQAVERLDSVCPHQNETLVIQ